MKWNELQLWKKFGIVFIVMHIIFAVLVIFLCVGENCLPAWTLYFLDFPLIVMANQVDHMLPQSLRNGIFPNLILPFILLGSIYWGIIGALTGLLIQKFTK